MSRERHHRVPPPLTSGGESIEGIQILEERGDELGLLLWHSLRNVLTWNRTASARRANIFTPRAAADREADLRGTHVPRELLAQLDEVRNLLDQPSRGDRDRLADACGSIATWAEAQRHLAVVCCHGL